MESNEEKIKKLREQLAKLEKEAFLKEPTASLTPTQLEEFNNQPKAVDQPNLISQFGDWVNQHLSSTSRTAFVRTATGAPVFFVTTVPAILSDTKIVEKEETPSEVVSASE